MPPTRPLSAGFTLLEIMVVIALIGIITSFAVISIRGNTVAEQLETEARRLAALIELNRQEAIMLSRQRGVRFNQHGYTFVQFDDHGDAETPWRVVEQGAAPLSRNVATAIEINLVVEGRPLVLEADSQVPQILLLSSGEVTDFSVTFASAYATGYTLAGDAFGQLALAPVR
jgi:general secretion pathway protein H